MHFPSVFALRVSLFLTAGILTSAGWPSHAGAAEDAPSDQATLGQLPSCEETLGHARVTVEGDRIVLSTGRVERVMRWTGRGLLTESLKDLQTGAAWQAGEAPAFAADWQLPEREEPLAATLKDLQVRRSDDEGFTGEMLEAEAEFEYPQQHLALRWRAWVWPDAPGIRTQLLVKSLPGFTPKPWVVQSGIDPKDFRVVRVSSERVGDLPPAGRHAGAIGDKSRLFDGDALTGWLSASYEPKTDPQPPTDPNEIVVDLGRAYEIRAFGLQQMTDYQMTGRIEQFSLFVSPTDGDWGEPVAEGQLDRVPHIQIVAATPKRGRYVRLVAPATSELNLNRWSTGLSELRVYSNETAFPQDASLRMDYAPCRAAGAKRVFAGLFSDTQFRNAPQAALMREVTNEGPLDQAVGGPLGSRDTVDWANLVAVERDGQGLLVVKESHKAANQRGVDTGLFAVTPAGVINTGWGRPPQEIDETWGECWASWVILYDGGASGRSFTLKQFDRRRFPINIAQRAPIKVNTWGTLHAAAATQENVLKDLDAAKDVGIESLQIDDGWQINRGKPNEQWTPDPKNFPEGWAPMRRAAEERGIRLELWAAAEEIPLDMMKLNYDQGGFVVWKLDFADLKTRRDVDELMAKVREFILYTGHRTYMNWDITEIDPRYGYFFGRQYGGYWLKNAKPQQPLQSIYIPNRVLRTAWDLSHYLNLRQCELPVTDPQRVLPQYSDARFYSEQYLAAMTFAGATSYFESLFPYEPAQRAAIREILALYKRHRTAMWECIELPIGQPPDNASFTGWQLVAADRRGGYLLLFRERLCTSRECSIALHFAEQAKAVKIENLADDTSEILPLEAGRATFRIEAAADFRMLKYELQ